MSQEQPPWAVADGQALEAGFHDLGRMLGGPGSPVSPERVVRVAGHMVPHARHAGITLWRENARPTTVAATDRVVVDVDRLQYEVGQGPCLDASAGDSVVLSDNLTLEDRWPGFSPRCASEHGVRSMLSVMLSLSGGDRAALNLYTPEVDVFQDADVSVGAMLAPFIALAVEQTLHRRDVENLHQALTTSRQIGTAIGILMSRYRITDEQAFALLRKASQDMNRKLRDVADDVTLSGELPVQPGRVRSQQ